MRWSSNTGAPAYGDWPLMVWFGVNPFSSLWREVWDPWKLCGLDVLKPDVTGGNSLLALGNGPKGRSHAGGGGILMWWKPGGGKLPAEFIAGEVLFELTVPNWTLPLLGYAWCRPAWSKRSGRGGRLGRCAPGAISGGKSCRSLGSRGKVVGAMGRIVVEGGSEAGKFAGGPFRLSV